MMQPQINSATPGLDRISELFERLVENEREVLLPTVLPARTVITYEWPYSQSTFPYIVNRWLPSEPDDLAPDVGFIWQRVGVRILVAPVTDGAKAPAMRQMFAATIALQDYWRRRTRLKTTISPAEPTWLFDELQLTGFSGAQVFAMGGAGTQQSGVELTLRVPILTRNY